MTDAEKKRLRLLEHRSEAAGRGPIQGFELSPLPPKIAKIDPEMAARWVGENNARIKDYVLKLNTTLPAN